MQSHGTDFIAGQHFSAGSIGMVCALMLGFWCLATGAECVLTGGVARGRCGCDLFFCAVPVIYCLKVRLAEFKKACRSVRVCRHL
jgi:hypothetical protein